MNNYLRFIPKSDWISVKEHVPNVNFTVILCLSDGSVSTGYLSRRRPEKIWYIHDPECQNQSVLWWAYIPQTPFD